MEYSLQFSYLKFKHWEEADLFITYNKIYNLCTAQVSNALVIFTFPCLLWWYNHYIKRPQTKCKTSNHSQQRHSQTSFIFSASWTKLTEIFTCLNCLQEVTWFPWRACALARSKLINLTQMNYRSVFGDLWFVNFSRPFSCQELNCWSWLHVFKYCTHSPCTMREIDFFPSTFKLLGYSFYWVGQKVRLDFSIILYRKPKRTFWPTQY